MLKVLEKVLSDISVELIIVSVINIAGWFIVFGLNWRVQKKQLHAETREKTYHLITESIKGVEKATSELIPLISSADWRIKYAEGETKDVVKKVDDIYDIPKSWFEYQEAVAEGVQKLVAAGIALEDDLNRWRYAFPSLHKAEEEMMKVMRRTAIGAQKLSVECQAMNFNSITVNQKDKLIKDAKRNVELLIIVVSFMDGFSVLLNNKLIAPIYGYKRQAKRKLHAYYDIYKVEKPDNILVLKESGINSISLIK